jgi:hypothetical protein
MIVVGSGQGGAPGESDGAAASAHDGGPGVVHAHRPFQHAQAPNARGRPSQSTSGSPVAQAMAGLSEQGAPANMGGHGVDAHGGRVVGGGAGTDDALGAETVAPASSTPPSGCPGSLAASAPLGATPWSPAFGAPPRSPMLPSLTRPPHAVKTTQDPAAIQRATRDVWSMKGRLRPLRCIERLCPEP